MSRSQLTSTVEQNTGGAVSPYVAGKNKIINGDFGVWQRGTSFTNTSAVPANWADRFTGYATFSAGSFVVSQQTFTPGTAPVAGYESTYYLRQTFPSSGTISYAELGQKIEDVRIFAGQTVTLSFWAKANSAISPFIFVLTQNFGSGGSANVSSGSYTPTFSTSWARYSVTITLPSVAGKTIGVNSFLYAQYYTGAVPTGAVVDFWGWQLEAGSVATPFTTATGTLSGELAACQRYYYQLATGNSQMLCAGNNFATGQFDGLVAFPVTMRIAPSLSNTTGTGYYTTRQGGAATINSFTIYQPSTTTAMIYGALNAGLTAGQGNIAVTNNASASIGFSAEL